MLLGRSSPDPLCPYTSLCMELGLLDETADPYLPHTRCLPCPNKRADRALPVAPLDHILDVNLDLGSPLTGQGVRRPAVYSWLPLLHHHHLIASALWALTFPIIKWLSNAFPTFAGSPRPLPDEKAASRHQKLQMLVQPLTQLQQLTPLC